MESSTIPRSLRIGFTLTCTEREGVDASEFRALQNKSSELIKEFQLGMKAFIVRAKELDRDATKKLLISQLFVFLDISAFMKANFEIESLDEDSVEKRKWDSSGGAGTLSAVAWKKCLINASAGEETMKLLVERLLQYSGMTLDHFKSTLFGQDKSNPVQAEAMMLMTHPTEFKGSHFDSCENTLSALFN